MTTYTFSFSRDKGLGLFVKTFCLNVAMMGTSHSADGFNNNALCRYIPGGGQLQ